LTEKSNHRSSVSNTLANQSRICALVNDSAFLRGAEI